VLGQKGQHAERVLGAVEVELADVAQRLARRVRGRARSQRYHHRLVGGLRRLADHLRPLCEERHRRQDHEAVGDLGIVEQETRRLPRDLDALGCPAPAEVDRVHRLRRQEEFLELGARGGREHGERHAELGDAITGDAGGAARGRQDADAAAAGPAVPDQEMRGADHVVEVAHRVLVVGAARPPVASNTTFPLLMWVQAPS
jgi:hypothetical protein